MRITKSHSGVVKVRFIPLTPQAELEIAIARLAHIPPNRLQDEDPFSPLPLVRLSMHNQKLTSSKHSLVSADLFFQRQGKIRSISSLAKTRCMESVITVIEPEEVVVYQIDLRRKWPETVIRA
jgi:hypothetical protein